MRAVGLPNLRSVALPVRAIRVRAEARMPEGHPHVSWAHVGASWPVVPASDDANHSHAGTNLVFLVEAQIFETALQSAPRGKQEGLVQGGKK